MCDDDPLSPESVLADVEASRTDPDRLRRITGDGVRFGMDPDYPNCIVRIDEGGKKTVVKQVPPKGKEGPE